MPVSISLSESASDFAEKLYPNREDITSLDIVRRKRVKFYPTRNFWDRVASPTVWALENLKAHGRLFYIVLDSYYLEESIVLTIDPCWEGLIRAGFEDRIQTRQSRSQNHLIHPIIITEELRKISGISPAISTFIRDISRCRTREKGEEELTAVI